MRARTAFVLAALLAFTAPTARAQDVPAPPAPPPAAAPVPAPSAPITTPAPADPPVELHPTSPAEDRESEPPLGLFPISKEDRLVDRRMARSWGELPARGFIATTFDVGFVYLRPRVSLGYGKPFTAWFGVDVNPIASSDGYGAYGGLRLEIPFVDVRAGARYFSAFKHTYLPIQTSHDRLELETNSGAIARTTALEAELDAQVPIGPGFLLARGSVSYVTGIPDGQEVFEETLHVIVRPPWVWRARAGYALRLGHYNQHSIGVVVDVLDIPKRDDSRTVRVGPVLRLVLSRRVEIRGSFVMTVVSPDRIGLPGGDFTELGVRYRWASE